MRPSTSIPSTLTITSIFLLLLSLLQPTTAAKSSATSFCKCICFNNSTIIPLNPPSSKTSSHNLEIRSPPLGERADDDDKTPAKAHRKLTCADCTRAFCLDYNLPICKDAGDEDVFTTCFQRDSLKDETVVVIFIFATAGLLAWALVKPWVDRLRLRNRPQDFEPLVASQASSDGGSRNNSSALPRSTRQESARGGAGGNGTGNGRGG
ncbi:uncharacterized protein A1O9_03820, partial [Exophiala aquamarina CBS 119918]